MQNFMAVKLNRVVSKWCISSQSVCLFIDSNTSMASLTNRSAEMEVFDGEGDSNDSKSRRPLAKRKH